MLCIMRIVIAMSTMNIVSSMTAMSTKNIMNSFRETHSRDSSVRLSNE